MLKEEIEKLETIVDKEIDGYKNIEKLYTDKKEILIHGKGTDLYEVDSKIVNTYKNLNDLSEIRKNITKSMNITNFSMTDMINSIKKEDEKAAKKFEQKREEVSKLAKRIFELEKINLELVKHGIHITNKTIEAMLKGVSSITKEYNRNGKNIAKQELEMSSIVEDA